MKGLNKRKAVAVFTAAALLFTGFIQSCAQPANEDNENIALTEITEEEKCFSADFIDVGEGDCCLLAFPDGKTFLIDCGDKNLAEDALKRLTENRKDKSFDYVLLTHPDADHIGGAENVIRKFGLKTAFLPDIKEDCLNDFPLYARAYRAIEECGAAIKVSQEFTEIKGDDYFVAFLSPAPSSMRNSPYRDLRLNPSDDAFRNDVSPVVYVECYGRRFVFTGDSGVKQEKYVLDRYNAGVYDKAFGKGEVNLTRTDFLKVSHHGASDCSGEEFLKTLSCKNAVISVGGDNRYGHPSSSVIQGLKGAFNDCAVYRTDYYGTVSVKVFQDGEIKISTEINQ